jgi:hypothetical protein
MIRAFEAHCQFLTRRTRKINGACQRFFRTGLCAGQTREQATTLAKGDGSIAGPERSLLALQNFAGLVAQDIAVHATGDGGARIEVFAMSSGARCARLLLPP